MEQITDPMGLVKAARKNAKAALRAQQDKHIRTLEPQGNNWSRLTEVTLDPFELRRNNIIIEQTDPQAVHIDRLRTRTLRVMRNSGFKRLAITSPDAGCGKSTVAANLALSMARQSDLNVMLFDFDLRKPSLIHHLDLAERGPRFSALLHTRRNLSLIHI